MCWEANFVPLINFQQIQHAFSSAFACAVGFIASRINVWLEHAVDVKGCWYQHTQWYNRN